MDVTVSAPRPDLLQAVVGFLRWVGQQNHRFEEIAMKRTLVLAGLLGTLLSGPLAAQDTRPGVAVLPFENGGSYGKDKEDFDALRRGIAGMLLSELSQNPSMRLVDREQIQKLLDEQGLAAADRVDAQTAAKIGKLVGARYMIAGTF